MTLIFSDIWILVNRIGSSNAVIGEVISIWSRQVSNALHSEDGQVITDIHIWVIKLRVLGVEEHHVVLFQFFYLILSFLQPLLLALNTLCVVVRILSVEVLFPVHVLIFVFRLPARVGALFSLVYVPFEVQFLNLSCVELTLEETTLLLAL